MFLGLVRADIVNASMNKLQLSTMLPSRGGVKFCLAALLIGFIIQKSRGKPEKKGY